MDFEKTANREREEIHKAIWNIADNLRGAVDGWDFKSYVIGTMFYRFLSEDFTDYINKGEREAGNPDFDYAALDDADVEEAREDMICSKGYFLYPSELFCNVCKRAKDDENLNETMEKVFRHIEESTKGHESEKAFAGLFKNFDVNSDKLGGSVARRNERLCALLFGIRDMNLGATDEHKVDAFGDTYEFLMSMYAANAGKSGGEFFTPQQAAMLCARLALYGKDTVRKVYDPTCGSGSLLLKAARVIGGNNILKGYYGQEINATSHALCRINMFLHGVGFEKFDIACEDTLLNPQHWDDEPFDAIVSNPPYSLPWKGTDDTTLINDPRFAPAGVLAPKSKADFAFIMHCLSWLAEDGCAAIVCFPGIFYRSGAEQKIRQYLIDNNFIDALIQLSDGQFFGTSIAVTILVLRKNKPDNSVLFIDASNEAVKVNNGKEMTDENLDHIMAWYAAREEVAHTVHKATHDEIAANNYNLSVSTYIEAEKKDDEVDIGELNAQIATIVDKENRLRAEIDEIIKNLEN